MRWKKHMHPKHVKKHASKNVFEKIICIQKHVEITYASKNICQKAYTYIQKHVEKTYSSKNVLKKHAFKNVSKTYALKEACTGVWKIKRKTDLATW